jgi:hypothetical protein
MIARNFRRRASVSLAGLSLVLLSSSAAWGFRTIEDDADVPDGTRVHWPNGVFEYRVHANPDASIDAESLAEASGRALLTWASTSCARLTPFFLEKTAGQAVSGDGRNTIEFVETDWESLGYPKEATGATDVQIVERDDGSWEIAEADIYINAEHHRFSTEEEPGPGERSLLGVLVHEAGHALGLLHPCELGGEGGAPVCDEEDLPDAIMSPYYDAAQTVPADDDYDGLCYLYATCAVKGCEPGFTCVADECVPEGDGGGDGGGAGAGQGDGPGEGQAGESSTTANPTGASCHESNECEGGECLAGVKHGPICTQACGESLPGCPYAWSCETVRGRRVCTPPDVEDGCTLARAPKGSPGVEPRAWLWPAALLGLAWLARRRQRRFHSSSGTASRGARNGSH